MADEQKNDAPNIPPYLAWQTLTSFIEKLNKTAIPNRIDASLISNLSGTARGQLLGALRFLGLTNGNGAVTEKLKKLVKAHGTPAWRETLGDALIEAYVDLNNGVDLDTATPGELKERFREVGGIEGDTIEKAMRFYLNGLKDAGITYSPHLKIRQRAPRGSVQRRKTRAAGGAAAEELGGEGFGPPDGTFEIPLNIIGQEGAIYLPEEITVEQWKKINRYIEMVIGLRMQPTEQND